MTSRGKRVQAKPGVGKRIRKESNLKLRTGVGWMCRILTVAFAVLFGISVWKYGAYALENYRESSYMASVQNKAAVAADAQPSDPTVDAEAPPIEVDFALLREENPDVVAWIYCPDTDVNYPVLQGEDNDYYLRRGMDGRSLLAGSIFVDCRNAADLSDDNVIVYGHNMRNKSMFGLLPSYAKQEFYEEHPVWYLLTPTANYKVELFAGFVTSTSSLVYSTEQEKTEDGQPIMRKAWEDSNFQGGDPPKEGERTLTLSTCSYEFSDARYVLIGVLREIGGSQTAAERAAGQDMYE